MYTDSNLVIIVPADGPAPNGAWPSVGTMMTTNCTIIFFWCIGTLLSVSIYGDNAMVIQWLCRTRCTQPVYINIFREREIEFIGLFGVRGHRGPYSPYKLRNQYIQWNLIKTCSNITSYHKQYSQLNTAMVYIEYQHGADFNCKGRAHYKC